MNEGVTPHVRSVSRQASFRYALRGVGQLVLTQTNARIHAFAAAGVIMAAWWLRVSTVEWGVLFLAIGLVLCAEGLNTAIEFVVDLASPQWHALARDAKDVAAGAVLLASLAAAACGIVILLPKLMARF